MSKPALRKKRGEVSSFCCYFFLELIKNESLTPRYKHSFSKFVMYFFQSLHVLAKAGRQNIELFVFPLLFFFMSIYQKHPNNNRQGPLHVSYCVSNSISFLKGSGMKITSLFLQVLTNAHGDFACLSAKADDFTILRPNAMDCKVVKEQNYFFWVC